MKVGTANRFWFNASTLRSGPHEIKIMQKSGVHKQERRTWGPRGREKDVGSADNIKTNIKKKGIG